MESEDFRWIEVELPEAGLPSYKRSLRKAVEALLDLCKTTARDVPAIEKLRDSALAARLPSGPGTVTARVWFSILVDLATQGWHLELSGGAVRLCAPSALTNDPMAEKERVRAGHLVERDRHLLEETTRKFVTMMETRRLHRGEWHSIFSLLRDGRDLAMKCAEVAESDEIGESGLRAVLDPYIQIAEAEAVCSHTGLKLIDIWRYCRLTWSTVPQSVPGRRMLVLIRDRAAPNHPIVGIGALGSAVVQLGVRDEWIGWTPGKLVKRLQDNRNGTTARWLLDAVDQAIADIYLADFRSEGLISRTDLKAPRAAVSEKLRREAAKCRAAHERYSRAGNHKVSANSPQAGNWRAQAKTFLFRSKRALALANALEVRATFQKYGLKTRSPRSGFDALLGSVDGRQALSAAIRYIKSCHVGIDMADITVCGAIPPYTHILGGKLVALMLASPAIVEAYRKRYADAVSVIASSVKGALVNRRPNLVLLGTTSLYGVGSSQYNRLKVPRIAFGDASEGELRFLELGKTVGFGSYHFSQTTMTEIDTLAQQRRGGRRVNNIFGEGVNPKLRRIREALEQTGFPSDALLRHGSPRVVYGVPLATNFREILMGIDKRPRWIVGGTAPEIGTNAIIDFWRHRWLWARIRAEHILEQVAGHTTESPVTHGARVRLAGESEGLPLFRENE